MTSVTKACNPSFSGYVKPTFSLVRVICHIRHQTFIHRCTLYEVGALSTTFFCCVACEPRQIWH
jgi:hypothetical protein